MYSRQNDRGRDFRVPRNYGGNVIFSSPDKDIPTKQHSAKDQPVRKRYADTPEQPDYYANQYAPADVPQENDSSSEVREIEFVDPEQTKENSTAKPASLLSPIGALGSEELLLIALALIIFQGGKEPEVALLLLALLFIN